MKILFIALGLAVAQAVFAEDLSYRECICQGSGSRDCSRAVPTKCKASTEIGFIRVKENPAYFLCSLDAKTLCVDIKSDFGMFVFSEGKPVNQNK